jgi:hypothetical protein
VHYHPILMLIDEESLATTAPRATGRPDLPPADRAALCDYTGWVVERVGATGMRSCEAEVQRLVRSARRHGVRSVALDVLGDPAEPAVARERALGLVNVAIVRLRDEPAGAHAA